MSKMMMKKEEVDGVRFERAHRVGAKKRDRARPIIAKLASFKDKEKIKGQKRMLAGSSYGVNDQYPAIIGERRKLLLPVMKKARQEGKKAVLAVDRMYIHGRLYENEEICPWVTQRGHKAD